MGNSNVTYLTRKTEFNSFTFDLVDLTVSDQTLLLGEKSGPHKV